ncbi:MAG: transcriptional antiterminator RfaH [Alphaproteobacteria bacterium]|jgi:transcriptional antiterminator RfaH
MHDETGDSWAVADTQVHRECVAIENLTRQGYTGYCPMIARRIRHARRWRDVQRPLFPGYVFILCSSATQNWRPIFSTYGIKNLLCQGNRPSLIPGEFIESLKLREMDGVVVAPAQQFEKGQSVCLTGGTFDGLTATIAELDSKSRVTVLLDLLNGQVRAQVPIDGIREI